MDDFKTMAGEHNPFYEEPHTDEPQWCFVMRDGLLKEIARLTAELAKFQESSFNPDWSLLQATRGVVQEYREELEACKAELAAGKLMADFAKGAISDAIYTDDGLDGETGQRVLKIITEWQTSGTFDSALCDTLTGFETMLTKELTASQERERVLREAVEWALGERGEFGDEPAPLVTASGMAYRRRYWWRTELRKRAALGEP